MVPKRWGYEKPFLTINTKLYEVKDRVQGRIEPAAGGLPEMMWPHSNPKSHSKGTPFYPHNSSSRQSENANTLMSPDL